LCCLTVSFCTSLLIGYFHIQLPFSELWSHIVTYRLPASFHNGHWNEDVTHFPDIKDPEILFVFKDLMAASWDELPDTLISDANKVLSKNTDDKAAQEAMANVFRAAKAIKEFSGMLVSLRMAIDDSTGLGGEDVKPLPEEFVNALRTVYQRYTAYLDAFGPDKTYLRKKVETELGTKMIHLKMRCSGIGSEWGKVLQFLHIAFLSLCLFRAL
ncbi:hypothetical protein HYC85_008503, partial [Camellia sinensis]